MDVERVTISEMREWATAIFDGVEASGLKEIELDDRNYFRFWSDEIWGDEPPEVLVSNLMDDLKDVRSDASGPIEDRAVSPWHALDHFIGVMTRLSAELKHYDFPDLDRRSA